MRYLIFSSIAILSCIACSNDAAISDMKPLNLLKYNVPLTILAPDSAKVQTMDLVVQKDVSIKSGEDFYIQLFMSDATETNVSKLIIGLKADVKKGAFFSKFVQEDENGFIFENAIDSTRQSYDFRYLKIQGDNEFEFRTGLIGSFTLPEVKRMYKAVQGK